MFQSTLLLSSWRTEALMQRAKMVTTNVQTADGTFTPMLLTDRAKRSEQLRITLNKQRLASNGAWFVGSGGEFVHMC
jgi:hypothetical protein